MAGDPLPRCPAPACPVRWRRGEDRLCADHADDAGPGSYDTRKAIWGTVVAAIPPRA